MKEYMKDVNIPDLERANRETLCWDCKKACRGGCSWTDPDQMRPVDGWAALPTENGFCVYGCPEFERETWCCGRYRTAEDYILALEIRLTDTRRSLKKVKKTHDYLRTNNRLIKDQLDRELWQNTVHMSE